MINRILQNQGGIGVAATGAGKTFITAVISDYYDKQCNYRSIVIVPKIDLVTQTCIEYKELGLDAGEFSGTTKDYDNKHIISTWQTLQNVKSFVQNFDVVIVDECHGVKGQVIQDILNEHGQDCAVRIGVTATIPDEKTDQYSLTVTLGSIVYEIYAKELIDKGILACPTIHIKQLSENVLPQFEVYRNEALMLGQEVISYAKYKNSFFPDYKSESSFLRKKQERLEWISNYVGNLDKNTFILVNNVATAKKLAEMIPDAVYLTGADKGKVRKEIYSRFADNDNLTVIATTQIAYAGLNIKRIFNLVFVDIGKSFVRVLQAVGRGLRISHDKDSVDVHDITSDLKHSKKHCKQRMKMYAEAGYDYKLHTVKYDEDLGDTI